VDAAHRVLQVRELRVQWDFGITVGRKGNDE
jgi:hypothetical protein